MRRRRSVVCSSFLLVLFLGSSGIGAEEQLELDCGNNLQAGWIWSRDRDAREVTQAQGS
jgi:hypothetical protein